MIFKINEARVTYVRLFKITAISLLIMAASCGFFQYKLAGLNGLTVVLITAIFGILLLPLCSKNKIVCAIGGILIIYSFLNLVPRLISFLIPILYVEFPLSVNIGFEEVNKAFLFVFLSLALFILGVFAAGFLAEKHFDLIKNEIKITVKADFVDYLLAFIFILISHYLIVFVYQYSAFNKNEFIRSNNLLGFSAVLFSPGASLAIFMSILISQRSQGHWNNSFIKWIAIFLIYSLEQSASGSRGPSLGVLVSSLISYIVVSYCFKERLVCFVMIIVLCITFTFLNFQTGTLVRAELMNNGTEHSTSAGIQNGTEHSTSAGIQNGTEHSTSAGIQNLMLARLYAPTDTAILSINLPRDPVLEDQLLNIKYSFMSALNILVPGVVFKEARLNISQSWPFLFKMRDINLLAEKYYYESFVITAFGFFYLLFDWSGVFVFLLMGMVVVFIYLKIINSPESLRLMLTSWFCVSLGTFIYMMSLDDWIAMTGFWLVQGFVFVAISHGIKLTRNTHMLVRRWPKHRFKSRAKQVL